MLQHRLEIIEARDQQVKIKLLSVLKIWLLLKLHLTDSLESGSLLVLLEEGEERPNGNVLFRRVTPWSAEVALVIKLEVGDEAAYLIAIFAHHTKTAFHVASLHLTILVDVKSIE